MMQGCKKKQKKKKKKKIRGLLMPRANEQMMSVRPSFLFLGGGK